MQTTNNKDIELSNSGINNNRVSTDSELVRINNHDSSTLRSTSQKKWHNKNQQ